MRTRTVIGQITVALVLTTYACTTTQSSVTAPDGPKCQVNASGSPASFGASGGSGVATISAARECAWAASSQTAWIAITGSPSGQGDGSVAYTVAPNQVPSIRSGAVVIAATTVQVNQAAAVCAFTLSRSGTAVAAAGGSVSVDVATLAGCAWSASSSDSWIAVVGGQSGTASGTVSMSVAANAGRSRSGRVVVGNQVFTIAQDGAAAPPTTPTPTPTPVTVHLEGRVAVVLGRCPNIQFAVDGTQVATDSSTDFRKKSKCDDVRAGVNLAVDGRRDGAIVRADTVEIKSSQDD